MKTTTGEDRRAEVGSRLMDIYGLLRDRFGGRDWWPAESPFEVAIGAILTQNTAWKNVELAIGNLKGKNLLKIERLRRTPPEKIAELIRPAGYYNQKTGTLNRFVEFLHDRYQGRLPSTGEVPTDVLREELLAIKGIGPETADSILLYALDRPVFVVDTYTKRIFSRHLFLAANGSYDSIQDFFQNNLPRDIELYNDFHAQIVALGHRFCRPRPVCADCPLESLPRRLINEERHK
ncbi:endonuclease III domain-containing protein [candidate division KSB1 bacterium]